MLPEYVTTWLQVNHELFVYHVSNKCYKSYILKKTLTKLEEKSSKATEESEGDESKKETGRSSGFVKMFGQKS